MTADMKRLLWAADMIEIQQLSYRYAICADAKDPAGIVALYAPNSLRYGKPIEHEQLIQRFAHSMTGSAVCILNVGNTLIDMDPDDPDRATGTVYCRCEAEVEFGKRWLIQQIVYHDKYVRLDGKWRFAERRHLLFYGADFGVPPINLPPSDAAELTDGKGSMPQYWPSYRKFWDAFPDKEHY
jgi:hypothetical protein